MSKRLKFIDLTHRLPGPLAGKILCDLGYEVIKIEDEQHKDPFLSGKFSEFDNSFEDWYKELNQQKRLVRLNFRSTVPSYRGFVAPTACYLRAATHGLLPST